jgi:uncharacterized damage-inducible protein DinB
MSTDASLLQDQMAYHAWANERIASFLEALPEAWLDQPCSGSFHSIRETALHMADAEQIWLERLQGQSNSSWPSRRPGASTHPLAGYMRRTNSAFLRYVETRSEAWFRAWCRVSDRSGRTHNIGHAGIVQHVINHSSYHRGQLVVQARAVADLAEIGQAPAGELPAIPGTDYIAWLREAQGQRPDANPELEQVYGA